MSSSGNGNGTNPDQKIEDFVQNLQELKAMVTQEYRGKHKKLIKERDKFIVYHLNDTKTRIKICNYYIIRFKNDQSEYIKTMRELNIEELWIQEFCKKNSGLDSENQLLKFKNEELKKKLAVMLEADAKRLEQEEKEKEECPICLYPIQDEVKTKCSHCFCRRCIIDSMKRKPDCPLCRQEIKERFDLPKVDDCLVQNSLPWSFGGEREFNNNYVSTRGGGHPDDDSDDDSDDDTDDG
jgi:hypothetical protein